MSHYSYLCKNDLSDEDCKKCSKCGIILKCPVNCQYFEDIRKDMTPEILEERARLMAILGTKDSLPWE